MKPLLALGNEYYIFGGAGVISLVAFLALILTPALSAFGRGWEKAIAGFLSILALTALVGAGIGAGLVIVYYWDDISKLF